MAYDFATLQSDIFARGFQPLNDAGAGLAMVKRMINDSMHWVDGLADWPYRQATITGVTPLTIADLGTIESVADVTGDRSLYPVDRRTLRTLYGDLTNSGTAEAYYITAGVLSLYPVQASLSITVDYWKVAPDLSASGDTPLMPDRYRSVIVEDVSAKLLRLRREPDVAAMMEKTRDSIVAQMMQELLLTQHQAAQDFVPAYGEDC
jgi:hypothetical protein